MKNIIDIKEENNRDHLFLNIVSAVLFQSVHLMDMQGQWQSERKNATVRTHIQRYCTVTWGKGRGTRSRNKVQNMIILITNAI